MADDPVFEKARQKAFRLLSLRGRSTKEIRSKLREQKFEEPVINRVIDRLLEDRYLDDAAFARDWARSLAENRLYGNRRIEMSLIEKGIADSLIKETIAGVRKERPERETLEAVIRKKLKDRKLGDLDRREKQRLARSLIGRGFPAGLVFEMFRIKEEGSFDERE
jgi:regulatory protein